MCVCVNSKLFYLEEDASDSWTPHQFSSCTAVGGDCWTYCDASVCTGNLRAAYNESFITTFGEDEAGKVFSSVHHLTLKFFAK